MREGWAWVSLSAFSETMQPDALRARLPDAKLDKKNRLIASVEISGTNPEARLSELLGRLEEYLVQYRDRLRDLSDQVQFQLRIGWSPLAPQENLVLPARLLLALGELNADVMLDTYSE